MTVVAVDEPDVPVDESVLDLWLCVLEPRDIELNRPEPERRERAVDEGDDFEIRRTSLTTRTLKMRAASGTTRKMNISVTHDQTDQNLDMASDVNGRTSHRADSASYAQK